MAKKIKYPRAAKQANYIYSCWECPVVCYGETREEAQAALMAHKRAAHESSNAVIHSKLTGRPHKNPYRARQDGRILGVNTKKCSLCHGSGFICGMRCSACGGFGDTLM